MVTLPINLKYVDAMNDIVSNQVNDFIFRSLDDLIAFGNGVSNIAKQIITEEIHDKVEDILKALIIPQKRSDLFKSIALSNQSKNRAKYLDVLINIGWIAKEFPDEVNHPTQRYFTTESGKRILALISI